MSKFIIDADQLSTEIQLLPPGFYAAEICNAGIDFANGGSAISIREIIKYPKNSDPVPTGKLTVSGRFSFGVTLFSKEAIYLLQRDTPKVFGGEIRISADVEKLKMLDCPPLGKFLQELGLKDVNFSSLSSFTEDQNIDVDDFCRDEFPGDTSNNEEIHARLTMLLKNHPDAVSIINLLYAIRGYLQAIAITVNGQRCRVKIKQQANRTSPDVKENAIDCGTLSAPFCGILSWKEGCEEDRVN